MHRFGFDHVLSAPAGADEPIDLLSPSPKAKKVEKAKKASVSAAPASKLVNPDEARICVIVSPDPQKMGI